ncbi:MAG: inositol monophosphatase [Gallionella sp.]|nr:inositol monophosphatase [Gallionella sp.]
MLNKPEIDELLELSKSIATQAGRRLLDDFVQNHKNYVHSRDNPKEIKALADTVLEKDILQALAPTGFPILSEEAGYIPGRQKSKYWFIVDPLDGTFNFVKGLGPSAVSIAFWKEYQPIFGVVYNLVEQQLAWGGAGIGAYCDGRHISVSSTAVKSQASICTGFPVRFDIESDSAMQKFLHMIGPFAKVRMLGAAAVSLVNVAKGAADAYSEQNIMLWDVAAGLAIVEGANGSVHYIPANIEYSLDVFASNGIISR